MVHSGDTAKLHNLLLLHEFANTSIAYVRSGVDHENQVCVSLFLQTGKVRGMQENLEYCRRKINFAVLNETYISRYDCMKDQSYTFFWWRKKTE